MLANCVDFARAFVRAIGASRDTRRAATGRRFDLTLAKGRTDDQFLTHAWATTVA